MCRQLSCATQQENLRLKRSRLSGVTSTTGQDFSCGVCQGTSFHPSEDTHIEIVRSGKGSHLTSRLMTVLTPGNSSDGEQVPWWKGHVREVKGCPGTLGRSLWVRKWSERSVVALAMQSFDSSLTVTARPNRAGGVTLRTEPSPIPPPTRIPAPQEAMALLAEELKGEAFRSYEDVAGLPLHLARPRRLRGGRQPGHRRGRRLPPGPRAPRTAHRRRLGRDRETWREPGADDHRPIRASDAAVAEQGAGRPRPEPGARYRRVDPITPVGPVVPASAPA